MKRIFLILLSLTLLPSFPACTFGGAGNSGENTTPTTLPAYEDQMVSFPSAVYVTENGVRRQCLSAEITGISLYFTYYYPDGDEMRYLCTFDGGGITALTQFLKQGDKETIRIRKIIRDKRKNTLHLWNYDPDTRSAKVDSYTYTFDASGRVSEKVHSYDTWNYAQDGSHTTEKDKTPTTYHYGYSAHSYDIWYNGDTRIYQEGTPDARPYIERYTTTIPFGRSGTVLKTYSYCNMDGTPTVLERSPEGIEVPVMLRATVEEFDARTGLQSTRYRILEDGVRILEKKEDTVYNETGSPISHNGTSFSYTDGKPIAFENADCKGEIEWGEIPANVKNDLALLFFGTATSPFFGTEDVTAGLLPYTLSLTEDRLYTRELLFGK